ncbi:MAG: hypothetical protein AB7S38_43415 [Vulcanimicrobiota bacterium]
MIARQEIGAVEVVHSGSPRDAHHRAAFAAWAAEPFYLCSADIEMATHWRRLAQRLPLVERFVQQDRLPDRPEPRHLLALLEEALSPTESTIVRFFLHVWNRYENPFALDELLGWDDPHRQAFADWFSGRATGQPGQYFSGLTRAAHVKGPPVPHMQAEVGGQLAGLTGLREPRGLPR